MNVDLKLVTEPIKFTRNMFSEIVAHARSRGNFLAKILCSWISATLTVAAPCWTYKKMQV